MATFPNRYWLGVLLGAIAAVHTAGAMALLMRAELARPGAVYQV